MTNDNVAQLAVNPITEQSSAFSPAGLYSKWLGLVVPERLGDVPFREMATLEFRPAETVIKNGFRFPKSGSTVVTPDDFPAVIEAIMHECEAELGPGAGSPAARPNETSRRRG